MREFWEIVDILSQRTGGDEAFSNEWEIGREPRGSRLEPADSGDSLLSPGVRQTVVITVLTQLQPVQRYPRKTRQFPREPFLH